MAELPLKGASRLSVVQCDMGNDALHKFTCSPRGLLLALWLYIVCSTMWIQKMELRRADDFNQHIEDQNIISVTNIRKLRLLCFLDRRKWRHLEVSQDWQNNLMVSAQPTIPFECLVVNETCDAILIDLSDIGSNVLLNIRMLVDASNMPVIAIGRETDRVRLQELFETGIHDFIHEDEATTRHIMRIVSYAYIRHQNVEKVREFAQRHEGIVHNATEGIFQSTADGRYILANPALARLYGFSSPEELMGNLTDIAAQLYVDSDRRKQFSEIMAREDKVMNFESEIRRKDGSVIWISENARAVRSEDGDILYYEGFVRNITSRKNTEEQLLFLAQRDSLTGLPNRTYYQEQLVDALKEAKQSRERLAILFIDLDNFKRINDTMGHAIGDQVLQTVAKRLLSSTSSTDCVARMSGDEFTVILRDIGTAEKAARVVNRLLRSFREPMVLQGKENSISASIGIAIYPDDGDTIKSLLSNADTAAYYAKNRGKNAFQFYTENLGSQVTRRLHIENELRHAVERGELRLLFQPKVNIETQEIIGAEALLRWHSSVLGSISPDEFIPIAEETGTIIPIGEWVLDEACRQIRHWIDDGIEPVRVAVNLSGRQFHQQCLLSMIKEKISTYSIPAHLLELELTESALVEHVNEARVVLEKLSKIGIQISIDDFGTGYSSLAYLKKFPISTVKVDRSFVQDIPSDKDNIAIIRAIISLAESLDLKVVAEGVETISQSAYLHAMQCDFGQGYLYSKPVDASALACLLNQKTV